MRLRRLVIRGFAQLRGSYVLDAAPASVGLLLADNESGKSTLAAAIRAALYGLEADRRRNRGKTSEWERFRPWEGGAYGLRLELWHDGRELVIERDFERASVRVLSGGEDRTQSYQSNGQIQVGQALTGLTRRQFELSCFVAQGDVVFADAGELGEALQRVAASEASGSTAARALSVLDEALQQYDGFTLKGKGRVETEIRRCEEEIDAAAGSLRQLEQERLALGTKLDLLRADGERQEVFEQRRDLLRAGRLRSELMSLGLAQDEARALSAKTEAMALQVGREASLRELTVERVARVEELRQLWVDERRAAREQSEAAAEGERRRRELEARSQALRLSRRPTDRDRDTLLVAMQRLEDARLHRLELGVELDGESETLRARGFEPEAAEALVARFESLAAEDRERIATRGQEGLRAQQQRHELEESGSQLRRRRAEIRHAQQTRKHFGIWCLVVGMLPMMLAITMYAHLPFSPWFLYGTGAAFFLTGMVALASGQRLGRREDESLGQLLARQFEALAACEAELAAAEQRWQALATRVGLSPDALESHYRDWRLVERSVDTMRRLQERRQLAEEQDLAALASMAPIAELFQRPAHLAALPAWRDELAAALELYRQRDAVDVLARDAQRRADEATAQMNQREQELRALLATMNVEVEAGEDPSRVLASMHERAEAARAARERAQQHLPQLQRQLAASPKLEALAERIATGGAELELCEQRLEARAARGPEFGFEASVLREPLAPDAFDRGLTRLDEEERQARGADEADRHAAQHFLIRYEEEAPALREKLEQHRIAHERAVSFAAAIRLAHSTLEQVARDTHRDWSISLNAELTRMLAGLGSEVQEAQLDEKLRLRLSRSGKLLAGEEAAQQLSAGAVERVYLAIRIALARVLARDGQLLPLILDDPFANADDARLVQGLRLLVETIAPTQQVLLLACQGSRYAWARHRLPEPERLVPLSLQQIPSAGRSGADS